MRLNNNLQITFSLSTILIYLYFFLEWLFFFTKPSFLTKLTLAECISVLFVAPLAAFFTGLVLITAVHGLSKLVKKDWAPPIIPALVLTAITFILIDNFTHTLFGFYVGSYTGYSRYGYFALLVLLYILSYLKVSAWLKSEFWNHHLKLMMSGSMTLPLASTIFFLVKIPGASFEHENATKAEFTHTPNIILLSTDGLVADHMSAYGYTRDTTPFITQLAAHSLHSENSFTNSSATTGSVSALLSGKLPAKTGVVFPPSVFNGIHIFQHFAGLLHKNGYRSLDIGTPHFADSYDLNMRDAFDFTLARNHASTFKLPVSVRLPFASESYFQNLVGERIKSRLLHALMITDMMDAYRLVTDMKLSGLTDHKRLEALYRFIDQDDEKPFFAHLHLMETHGPRFDLSANHFSVDQKQDKSFKRDFYDDAILNFDNKVKEVANFLKQKNLFDNTILVITTDHGTRWSSNKRLPLIIKFPYSRHSGLTSGNTQRADIPPTILDYLGAEIPQWMDGDSLISGNIDKKRVIYSATSAENHMDENGDWRIIDYSPPFYALGKLAIIQCQQWIQLDLITKKLEKSEIENHTSPCVAEDLLSQEQAYELIVEHLMDADYDMSGFTKKEVLFGQ